MNFQDQLTMLAGDNPGRPAHPDHRCDLSR